MVRITDHSYAELIEAGKVLVPSNIRPLVDCDFFTGSAIFAGFDRHPARKTTNGRDVEDTWYCLYDFLQVGIPASWKKTTVVLAAPIGWKKHQPRYAIASIVHELGHVLHERLDFCHNSAPVTEYAETNRYEAFAEAFTAYCMDDYLPWGRDSLFNDKLTMALFDSLKTRGLSDL